MLDQVQISGWLMFISMSDKEKLAIQSIQIIRNWLKEILNRLINSFFGIIEYTRNLILKISKKWMQVGIGLNDHSIDFHIE